MKFPVSLLGKKSFWLSQQTIYRKWTGWKDELGIQDGDRWVYIAEQGTVYHKTSGCTYLNLSIQSVEDVQIAEYRNESGEKYHKCELCADKINKFGRVYITNYGNKYHTDLNCSGIKSVPLLLLGGMTAVLLHLFAQEESVFYLMTGMSVGIVLLLYSLVTHESIGYGDGCLFVMTGLFLGFWENLVLLLLASVLAGIGAAVLLFFRKKKKKERIPFVPFVFTAYVLLLL